MRLTGFGNPVTDGRKELNGFGGIGPNLNSMIWQIYLPRFGGNISAGTRRIWCANAQRIRGGFPPRNED